MNAQATAIVDSSAMFASLNSSDLNHDRCLEALRQPGQRLVVPSLVLCEVLYLTEQRLGPAVEAAFLASLSEIDIQSPLPSEWQRIAELVKTYESLPLGGVDASVVALAERLDTDLIITLDRRHFGVVRPHHVPSFRLLPE